MSDIYAQHTHTYSHNCRDIQNHSTNSLSSISTSALQQSSDWQDNAHLFYRESLQAIVAMQGIIREQSKQVEMCVRKRERCEKERGVRREREV
jgi:hypothetical protein